MQYSLCVLKDLNASVVTTCLHISHLAPISEHKQNTHNDGNRVSEFDEKKTVIHGYVLKHSNHDDPKKSLKLTF